MAKRWLLLISILLLFGLPLRAQPDTMLSVSIGARGMYGFSGISMMPYEKTEGLDWMEAGMLCRLSSSRLFAMRIELNYARNGYTTVEYTPRPFNPAVAPETQMTCKQQWINLPLLAEFGYSFKLFHIHITAGAFADFLLEEQFGPTGNLQKQQILLSTHNRIGLAVTGGAAAGIETSFGTLLVEYRTMYRVASLYKRPVQPAREQPRQNLRNHTFGISYYYTFTFHKETKSRQ